MIRLDGCVFLSRETEVSTFASLAMGDGLGGVSVVAFLAVVTVSARCEVSTLEAHAPAHSTT